MIAVPFVYFSLLLGYIIKKRGFELSAYLVLLYVIISLFGILIDINDLRAFETKYYEISIDGAFLYCLLLTISIIPFYNFRSNNIEEIRLLSPKSFDKIVYVFFMNFVALVAISYNSIIKILSGNLGELRSLQAKGEGIVELGISGLPLIVIFTISNFSIIMLLFYFYSICFLKKSKLFNSLTLISSLAIVLIGILGVDRSKTFYWMITYGAMIVLFWKYMNSKLRNNIKVISLILSALLLTYFIAMTVSRFGEREIGTEGGIIYYAGQSYLNFCFFYDKVHYSEFSLQRIFPLIYDIFIDNGIRSSVELNNEIENKTGYFVGLFSTFLGDIMVASGVLVTILYNVSFSFISNGLLKRKTNVIYFHNLIFFFCLLLVPMLGIFVHFSSNYMRSLAMLIFMVYATHITLIKK